MSNHLLSPRQEDLSVLFAAEEHVLPERSYGPVIRSIFIIECCTGGKGSVSINGKEFSFGAGACYALLPGDTIIHHSDPEEGRSGFWCALSGTSVKKYLKKTKIDSEHPFFPACVFENACEQIRKMVENKRDTDLGSRLRLLGLGYTLLGFLVSSHASETEGMVEKAIGLIQTDYPLNLTVERIANAVGFERSYFTMLFKEKTGISPHQYLMQFRLSKACSFLKESSFNVFEIAERVGMDPHNFSRFFTREIGMSPLQYRQKSQKANHPLTVEEKHLNRKKEK